MPTPTRYIGTVDVFDSETGNWVRETHEVSGYTEKAAILEMQKIMVLNGIWKFKDIKVYSKEMVTNYTITHILSIIFH